MTSDLPALKSRKFHPFIIGLVSFVAICSVLRYCWLNSTTVQKVTESRFTRTRPITFQRIDKLLYDFDDLVDLYPDLNPLTDQRTWVLAYGVTNVINSTHYLKVNASAEKHQDTVHRVVCTFDGNIASDSNRNELILRISKLFFELDEVALNGLVDSESSDFLVEGYQRSNGQWTCKLLVSDHNSLVIEFTSDSEF